MSSAKTRYHSNRRKISRLSTKINESFQFNQEEIDISNFVDEKLIQKTQIRSNLGISTVQLNLTTMLDKKQKLHNITVNIENINSVFELINKGINIYNELFEKLNLNFRLDISKIKNYVLKRTKKNGKPDCEIPGIFLFIIALNHEATVASSGINNFSFIYNEKDVINIKLLEERKFSHCRRCSIF